MNATDDAIEAAFRDWHTSGGGLEASLEENRGREAFRLAFIAGARAGRRGAIADHDRMKRENDYRCPECLCCND